MNNNNELNEIFDGNTSLKQLQIDEFIKFKGKEFARIVSEKTYQKILSEQKNLIQIIKKSSSKVTKMLEKRQGKQDKNIKDKYKLKQYIQLTKQIHDNTDETVIKDLIKELCDLYAYEISDNFSTKFYKVIKIFLLLWLKYIKKTSKFTLHISGKLNNIYEIAKHNTIIYTPMHKSHMDSLWIGSALASYNLPPVRYAAGIHIITSFIRKFFLKKMGAYIVDREEKNNPLYLEVLKQYSIFLIENGIDTLIFPEGLRSRTGSIGSLKNGLLKTAIDAYLSNDKKYDIVVIPITLTYEEVPEDCVFCGDKKRLNFRGYIKNIKDVYIRFCNPIMISEIVNNSNPVVLLGNKILSEWKKNVKILPHHILCKILVNNNYEIQKNDMENAIEKIVNSLNTRLYKGISEDIDSIINHGMTVLKNKNLISENGDKIKALNTKIVKYYANMIS